MQNAIVNQSGAEQSKGPSIQVGVSMFSKKEAKSNGRSAGDVPVATGQKTRTPMPSILAPDIRITGDIKGEGDVSIEGPLDGNVTARCVTVGPEGHVTGSIKAERVVISGTVQGDVKAGEISFSASSKFKGTVTVHEYLEVERGARFEGKTVWASTGAAKVAALESFANSGRKPGDGSATQSNGGVSQIKSGSSGQTRITAR
ncbi:MAG: polymer-forming cytoskeletal protein [Alphaproteobacteria bacterium]|nr:polymer-forming cytoskeletal protein [Alphaproteobacteria bacterium]